MGGEPPPTTAFEIYYSPTRILILLQAFYRRWYLLSIISLARGRGFGRDSPTHSSPPRPATSILLGLTRWGYGVEESPTPISLLISKR